VNLKFINTGTVNPHRNLALEEYLLGITKEDDVILYLWQNENTVVIGKNQNAYKECRVQALRQSGGSLARRLSGGGAVYHDLGNLNFTFLAHTKNYDVQKQLEVIAKAVRSFGLDARKSGRNDICVDERKFSGNAFLKKGQRHYHHGTILISVDMQRLSEFLSVSPKKLQAKGVDSVKSRVVNLAYLEGEITVSSMRRALRQAFEQTYGQEAAELKQSGLDEKEIELLYKKYSSDNWLFPEKAQASFQMSERFSWGEITIGLEISGDIVRAAAVYSDAMEADLAPALERALTGSRFLKEELAQRALLIGHSGSAEDISRLILSQRL
jgi:lipoate-protein ligase A